jgi:ATP-dependent RNA helicase RhlE
LSFTRFSLHPRLHQGIARAGYDTPTPVQAEAIPAIMDGHDLIATAQTGTGKTAAFVLPMLHRLIDGPRRRARALIVTPTRELAEQIHTTVKLLGMGTNLRSAVIYGGVSAIPQRKALREGAEILVVCPGRMLDHIGQGDARLDGIEILVLDEADRMLDMGFLPDVRRILSHLPAQRQTLLFSATFPAEIEQLARGTLRNPQRVALGLSRPVHTVSHALYPVRQHLKTPLLLALLERSEAPSVLVFTRTRHRASKLERQLVREGYSTASLHSDRSQQQRQAALDGFRSGKYRVLVATDIAARGIDVENISHVINYDMPDTADAYIHRIGRTGRAERTGEALTLAVPDDAPMVKTLEKLMGSPLQRSTLTDFDYNAPAPPKSDTSQERGAFSSGNGRQQPRFERGSGNGRGTFPPKRSNGSGNGSSAHSDNRSSDGNGRSFGTSQRDTAKKAHVSPFAPYAQRRGR